MTHKILNWRWVQSVALIVIAERWRYALIDYTGLVLQPLRISHSVSQTAVMILPHDCITGSTSSTHNSHPIGTCEVTGSSSWRRSSLYWCQIRVFYTDYTQTLDPNFKLPRNGPPSTLQPLSVIRLQSCLSETASFRERKEKQGRVIVSPVQSIHLVEHGYNALTDLFPIGIFSNYE